MTLKHIPKAISGANKVAKVLHLSHCDQYQFQLENFIDRVLVIKEISLKISRDFFQIKIFDSAYFTASAVISRRHMEIFFILLYISETHHIVIESSFSREHFVSSYGRVI